MGGRRRTIAVMSVGIVVGSLLVTPRAARLSFTEVDSGRPFAQDALRDYCARSVANPRSYPPGPCTEVRRLEVADGYGIIPSLSLAVGSDGLPIASYWSGNPDRELRAAQCDNPACTGPITVNQVEANPGDPAAGGVGLNTSIAIGADGLPVIAHWDQEHGDLIVSHCGNAACSTGNQSTTVDDGAGADVGSLPSVAIGADNLPVMSFFDDTDDVLQVTHCNDAACAGQDESLTTVDSGVDGPSSLAIGVDGLPILSYAKGGLLKTAHCGNAACTSGVVIRTLDPAVGTGRSTLTIGT